MNKVAKALTGFLTGTIMLASAGAGYLYTQRDVVIEKIAATLSDYATQALGTKVGIGSIKIGNLSVGDVSDISVSDLAIYDKHSDLIARAESAEVNLRLLALASDPLSAIDEIKVHNVAGNIVKRDDETWNFSDLQTSSEGKSNFDANILVDSIKINATFDDNEIAGDVSRVNLDFDTTADFSADFDVTQIIGSIEGYHLHTGGIEGTVHREEKTGENTSFALDLKALDSFVNIDGNKLVIDKIEGTAKRNEEIDTSSDYSLFSNVYTLTTNTYSFDVQTLGSNINLSGSITDNKQIANINVDTIDIAKVLPFIPNDILPAGVELLGGVVNDAKVNLLKRYDNLSFSGSASLQDGSVLLEQTQIDDINGSATFTDAEVFVNASAQSNGQHANINGSIKLNTDEPYLDLKATSDSFDPSAVMYLPAEGVAAFTAHLTGTPSNPIVEADIQSPYVAYENITATDVATHLKYQDNAVYLSNIRANTFGGTVTGSAELMAMDLSFNAHLTVDNAEVSQFSDYVPVLAEVDGRLFGDVGISGIGGDLDKLKVYGSATASNVNYEGAELTRADSSFSFENNNVKIDYLSASLPSGGSLGAEGTVTDGNKLDLNFYGEHVDLSIAEPFIDQAGLANVLSGEEVVVVSGLADFKGSVHGDVSNPNINLKFSAVDAEKKGAKFLDQPYDSIVLSASGSLDGVEIDEFIMTKDGKDVWQVIDKGTIGFTGDKNINVRLDTVGARAETIIQLVAPDQPLTGNVDNTIQITGTLDNPNVVGYIHFWRGSYRGMLVNSMDGDYTVDGDIINVNDFHITSPTVDMVLNGTIDRTTTDMDFTVNVDTIDIARFKGKLPQNYSAQGQGTFVGKIGGNLDIPTFDGHLKADNLNLNGVDITYLDGHVALNGSDINLDHLSLKIGSGTCIVSGVCNYVTKAMHGKGDFKDIELSDLAVIANHKTDLVTGTLNSNVTFGGTLQNPTCHLVGTIPTGTVVGSDIHDVTLDLNLINRTVYINDLIAYQGEKGSVSADGSAQIDGTLDMNLTLQDIDNNIFGKIAGLNTNLFGTTTVQADITGTGSDPIAHVDVLAYGGIEGGSAIDRIHGLVTFQGGVFDIQELVIQKNVTEEKKKKSTDEQKQVTKDQKQTTEDKVYQISAKGQLPLAALTKDKSLVTTDSAQFNIDVSLDNADLSLIPLLNKKIVPWASGEMEGKLAVTGTADQPLVNGNILVNDGTVKIKGMKNLIEHMNMNLAFTGDKMTVEDFSGNIGKGKYNLTGGLQIAGLKLIDYNFDLVADNLEIISDAFTGPVNGRVNVSRHEVKNPSGEVMWIEPKITTEIDLDKCTIAIPTIPESEGELMPIRLDVTLRLGDKVHFYSPMFFDLYLTGEARFEGSTITRKQAKEMRGVAAKEGDESVMDMLHPSGIITAKRGGTVSYLKTVFNVRDGELHFQQGSLFPSINFFAETKITKTKVFLTIDNKGKDRVLSSNGFNEQTIKLSSSPEMSQTEIIQLLTLRDAYQKGGDNEIETGDLLMLGLQMSFLGEIESAVRKTIGFDQFSINRGSGSAFDNKTEVRDRHEEEYNVTVGKYVTDKTMLRYTRGIGGDNINRYGIQYDFNDHISGTVEREGHASIVGIEARWKFDIFGRKNEEAYNKGIKKETVENMKDTVESEKSKE